MAERNTHHICAVIMAGGSGKRFWPLSRIRTPKHLLPIFGSKSLLLQCAERVQPLAGWDWIYAVTTEVQCGDVASVLPHVPQENVICEPEGKNTASCIGLAALKIMMRDPGSVMAVLPSDHYIRDEDGLRQALMLGDKIADMDGSLVVFGVRPTRPETGYGYIEIGESLDGTYGMNVNKVKTFCEKPNAETAEDFLKRGNFLWNSGIFVWKTSTILHAIEKTIPDLFEGLQRIKGSFGGPYERKTIKEVYASLPSVSIDNGVLEKLSRDLVVITLDVGWSDVGSFASFAEVFENDAQGNVIRAHHVGVKSFDNIIVNEKRLVATVGVHGLVIVETDDAILVCAKEHAQDVKMLVDEIEKEGLKGYL